MSNNQFAKKDEPTYSFNTLLFDGFTINLPPFEVIKDLHQDNGPIPEGVKVYLFSQDHGHYDPNIPHEKIPLDENVARNQFDSLRFIIKHSDALIFPEGAIDAYTIKDNPTFDMERKIAKMLFVDGVPEKYEDLNLHQKKFLQMFQGSRVAYFLGIVDKFYRPNSADVESKVASMISEYGMSDEVLLARADIVLKMNRNLKPVPLSTLRSFFGDPYNNLQTLFDYYKSNPNEKCPETVGSYLTEYSQAIKTERENDLLRMVAQVTNQPMNSDKEVVVIYGAGHMSRLKDLFSTNLKGYEGLDPIDIY